MVRDLDADARLAADAEHLVDALHHPRALVAHVAGVDAVERSHRLRQLDDLLGARERAGRVDQPGGEAERALIHHPLDQLAHVLGLEVGRLALLHAHDGAAHVAVGDEASGVDGDPPLVEPRAVGVEVGRAAAAALAEDHRADQLVEALDLIVGRGQAEPAVADDLGGHALEDLRVRFRLAGQREVPVRVHVDEPRRDDHPSGVEHLVRRGRVVQPGDGVVFDREVTAAGGSAGAVEDAGVADEEAHGRGSEREDPSTAEGLATVDREPQLVASPVQPHLQRVAGAERLQELQPLHGSGRRQVGPHPDGRLVHQRRELSDARHDRMPREVAFEEAQIRRHAD